MPNRKLTKNVYFEKDPFGSSVIHDGVKKLHLSIRII